MVQWCVQLCFFFLKLSLFSEIIHISDYLLAENKWLGKDGGLCEIRRL